jgi:hypothetical protein
MVWANIAIVVLAMGSRYFIEFIESLALKFEDQRRLTN